MAIALWVFGGMPLLAWFGWSSWRYYVVTRRSLGLDPETRPAEVFTGLWDKLAPEYVKRQADPKIESLRRRVWLGVALWIGYMFLGYRIWAAIVGWMSL